MGGRPQLLEFVLQLLDAVQTRFADLFFLLELLLHVGQLLLVLPFFLSELRHHLVVLCFAYGLTCRC
jgi:hypothetical protein